MYVVASGLVVVASGQCFASPLPTFLPARTGSIRVRLHWPKNTKVHKYEKKGKSAKKNKLKSTPSVFQCPCLVDSRAQNDSLFAEETKIPNT